jgi:hypothetical protein
MAELPERLREAAVAHRPDRERMLARVEQAMAAPGPGRDTERERSPGLRDRPPAPWMRVTAVAAAVAGAVGLGGLAVGAVTGTGTPGQSVVSPAADSGASPPAVGSGTAGTATSRPHPSAHPSSTAPAREDPGAGHSRERSPVPPGSGGQGGTATPSSGPGSTRTSGGSPATSSGSADGVSSVASIDPASNAYWTQSDLKLTVGRPLTSLHVELRIAMTTGVSSTGSFDSVPGQTSATVTVEGDYLVYRWDLTAGQTLAPGTYTFAGQFNHAQGDRDTSGDRYTAVANGPGGAAALGGGY